MGKIITRYHHKGMPRPPVEGERVAKHFCDGEIHRRALADPEAQPLTGEQLAMLWRVNRFIKK